MSAPAFTLERLLTHKVGFDLATASPLQRAIARAADGIPVPASLLDDEAIEKRFGCERSRLGVVVPVLVVIVAGVRGGKSLMAACAAVEGVLTADLSALRRHEVPRFAIVAPTVDNARATFQLLKGHVEASPLLSKMVVGVPTDDTLTMRRPDGRLVEIVVVAAHRGAVTLRSRWLVGFVLDEVALFGAEAQGAAVNAEELLRAGETRLTPGAQGWLISSPFGPSGLLYDLWRAHFGKPGRVLVVHAPTRALNPAFPEEQIEALRADKPAVAAREHDAEWVDADSAFIDGPSIDAAVRPSPLEEPPRQGARYSCAWDAATRGNSWTLVVARAELAERETSRIVVALARQWTGSKVAPLDPEEVIAEIAAAVRPYGVQTISCDGWGADALQSIARRHGLRLLVRSLGSEAGFAAYDNVRQLFATSRLELPPVPPLVQDLKGLRKKASANAIRIELQKTSDGRHSDFCPSVALAVASAPRAQRAVEASGGGEPAHVAYWRDRLAGPHSASSGSGPVGSGWLKTGSDVGHGSGSDF